MPLTAFTVSPLAQDSVPPLGLLPIARVTAAELVVTVWLEASMTRTTGCWLQAIVAGPPPGWVWNPSAVAGPAAATTGAPRMPIARPTARARQTGRADDVCTVLLLRQTGTR